MILKINKDYFKNLANGAHTLKVNFKDGHAEGQFEVKNKITFTILDTTFTATTGMTWSDWNQSYGISAGGNGIIGFGNTVGTTTVYLDPRYKNEWSWNSGGLWSYEDELYDANDVAQYASTVIQNGAVYGRSSGAPT